MSRTHPASLGTAVAQAVASEVLASAAARGLAVSVAVVDERGFDLVVLRGTGASWFTPDVARTKARTAAAFARSSESLGGMRGQYPDLFELIADTLPFAPTSLPGGLPVEIDGHLLGAIGVSGAPPDEDVALGREALTTMLDHTP
ncbi:GlcG/HbpS family heme-binding protein [Knoellia sp. CPCC 206435]|uniref:GlcG/HbpS family heme-binding protein n=1 Tax=Knoellia terrae TaxID=3404797 RepID=UPI003B42EF0E